MSRALGRVLRVVGAVVAWLVVVGCNSITNYVPDQRLGVADGAILRVERKEAGFFGGETALDIFTLRQECPDLSVRLRSQGYQGSVMIDGHGTRRTLIPAGEAILLRLSWTQITPWATSHCDAGVIVKPDRGSEYAVRFISPAQRGNRCAIGLVELVENDQGQTEPERVENVVHLDVRGTWSVISPNAVCAAARQVQ
ncbi:MAG: hypothetical protein ABUS79_01015 [Pseudomonadota bacterium]